MFNGNYVTIDSILTRVKTYPFTEGLTKRDAAHQLADLIGLIGAPTGLVRKYANIQINQHKGVLPKDIIYIHGANNKGNSCTNSGIAMRYASDIYHSVLHSDAAIAECAGTTISTSTQVGTIYPPQEPVDTVEDLNWCEHVWAPALYTEAVPVGVAENSYTINGMSIDTSFDYGWVEIAYDSVQTDEEGFPMVPDDKSFKEAYRYFLLKNAAEPSFLRGDVQQYVYNNIETQYDWYVGQAGNSLQMLTPDQMQSMANGLVRIIPAAEPFRDGWKDLNKRRRDGY